MALAEAPSRKAQKGISKPRIAPPTPVRSMVKEFEAMSSTLGIELMPWQKIAGQYLTALGPEDRWLYQEVAVVVARQQGKTTLLLPLIISRLLAGWNVMHAAQTRTFPRVIHDQIATLLSQYFPESLPRRRGIRYGQGQEEIRLLKGNRYSITAASHGGARGMSNDLVIIDELREFKTHDFMGAAKPTLTASANPQMVYLSNAGEDDSVVLNSIITRAQSDPSLAYLEWSASPEFDAADRRGWLQANPAIGYMPKRDLMAGLERDYVTHKLAGTLGIFETENLCRSVPTLRQPLVEVAAWNLCQSDDLEEPVRPAMAVSLDPERRRASVAVAWQREDGTIGLRLTFNVTGSPIDTDALGLDIKRHASKVNAAHVGFDPMTDAELAKYLRKPDKVAGPVFANASAQFANLVNAGRLRWTDCEAVSDDLTWTSRKTNDEGRFEAVRAKDDRPITASLAAIRAVWLASGPKPAVARIY